MKTMSLPLSVLTVLSHKRDLVSGRRGGVPETDSSLGVDERGSGRTEPQQTLGRRNRSGPRTTCTTENLRWVRTTSYRR